MVCAYLYQICHEKQTYDNKQKREEDGEETGNVEWFLLFSLSVQYIYPYTIISLTPTHIHASYYIAIYSLLQIQGHQKKANPFIFIYYIFFSSFFVFCAFCVCVSIGTPPRDIFFTAPKKLYLRFLNQTSLSCTGNRNTERRLR